MILDVHAVASIYPAVKGGVAILPLVPLSIFNAIGKGVGAAFSWTKANVGNLVAGLNKKADELADRSGKAAGREATKSATPLIVAGVAVIALVLFGLFRKRG